MPKERDELAKLIFVADNWRADRQDNLDEWAKLRPEDRDYAYRIADAMLAAGYRKVES